MREKMKRMRDEQVVGVAALSRQSSGSGRGQSVLNGMDSLRSSYGASGSMNLSASAEAAAAGVRTTDVQPTSAASDAKQQAGAAAPAPAPASMQTQMQMQTRAASASASASRPPNGVALHAGANETAASGKTSHKQQQQRVLEEEQMDEELEMMEQLQSPRVLTASSQERMGIRALNDLYPSDESSAADEIFALPPAAMGSFRQRSPGCVAPHTRTLFFSSLL